MIVIKILVLQAVKAAVAGVGVEDVLFGDAGAVGALAVNEIEDLVVERFSLLQIYGMRLVLIFHSYLLWTI